MTTLKGVLTFSTLKPPKCRRSFLQGLSVPTRHLFRYIDLCLFTAAAASKVSAANLTITFYAPQIKRKIELVRLLYQQTHVFSITWSRATLFSRRVCWMPIPIGQLPIWWCWLSQLSVLSWLVLDFTKGQSCLCTTFSRKAHQAGISRLLLVSKKIISIGFNELDISTDTQYQNY